MNNFNETINNQIIKYKLFYNDFKEHIDKVNEIIQPLSNIIIYKEFQYFFVPDESISITFKINDNVNLYLDILLTFDEKDEYFSNCGLFKDVEQQWSYVGNLDDVINKVINKYK